MTNSLTIYTSRHWFQSSSWSYCYWLLWKWQGWSSVYRIPRWNDSIFIPRHNEVVGGILVSLRPSVRPSARPSRIPCPLCSAYSSGWIHFIFIHLIKQLHKVCRVLSFLQNFKIEFLAFFFLICNFDFVLFWLGIWCEPLVWVIMGRWGYLRTQAF